MIPEHFPAFNGLASLEAGEAAMRTCDHHKVLLLLSTTSKRLWEIFYFRSWMTRVILKKNFGAMTTFFKQVELPVYTIFIE